MTQLVLFACASLFLLLLSATQSSALVCDLYMDFHEEGKPRQIIRSTCGARNSGYCVKVIYWDTDRRRKRGYSGGCDANDCVSLASSNDTAALGWRSDGWRSDGCRKDLDYGSEGEICCCNDRDRCNAATSHYFSTLSLLTIALSFVLAQCLMFQR